MEKSFEQGITKFAKDQDWMRALQNPVNRNMHLEMMSIQKVLKKTSIHKQGGEKRESSLNSFQVSFNRELVPPSIELRRLLIKTWLISANER